VRQNPRTPDFDEYGFPLLCRRTKTDVSTPQWMKRKETAPKVRKGKAR